MGSPILGTSWRGSKLQTDTTTETPRISWAEHLETLSWRQGEHVTILGPTGCGKTTLAREILPRRSYVIALATKPKDAVLEGLRADGYRVSRDWPPPAPTPRMVIWPKSDHEDAREAEAHQASIFGRTLSSAFRAGGYCVYGDELLELTELKLKHELNRLWRQGRSVGCSLVTGSQRPFEVPQSAYSQATHLYLFSTNDDRDLRRLSEISGRVNKVALREIVAGLDWHDLCYANTRTGRMEVTRVES
jgi:energy-coupling factor transporter ATP-binding protein EcfA2